MLWILAHSDQTLVDEEAYVSERIAALNVSLINLDSTTQTEENEELAIDQFANVSKTKKNQLNFQV